MDIREAKIRVRTVTCTYSYKEDQDGIYEILHPLRAAMEVGTFSVQSALPEDIKAVAN